MFERRRPLKISSTFVLMAILCLLTALLAGLMRSLEVVHRRATSIQDGYRNELLRASKANQRITLQKAGIKGSDRAKTDAGVDLSDRHLYSTVDLKGDSSTATVMGMATGYPLKVYERFVGTLRKSGFKGNIILGVDEEIDQTTVNYFQRQRVSYKIMKWTNCTYAKSEKEDDDIFKRTTCASPYPDIKIRWSRFPLQRDWLNECKTCTGPVLIMDVRDSFFQLDPFGPGVGPITGLQVFQEHPSQKTTHWLTEWPIKQCKGKSYKEPMLCSGTTVGTRDAMLRYLEIMYQEMKAWIRKEECRFDINGDDQSIHNYLFYSRQLPFATSIPNRMGIVNTVGKEGAMISKSVVQEMKNTGSLPKSFDGHPETFPGATEKTWIGTVDFNVTDEMGYFTQYDGTRSRVVHQFDRFGEAPSKHFLRTGYFEYSE